MRFLILLLSLILIPTVSKAGKLAEKFGVDLTEKKSSSGISSKLKKGARSVAKFLPDGGLTSSLLDKITGEESIEEKVDRIDKKQAKTLDNLRNLAYEAIQTKKEIEEIYYFKKRAQEDAAWISRNLSKGNNKKFLGATVQNMLKIPLNPAEYIPNVPASKKLKENLDMDLSFEQGVLSNTNYLLSSTRKSIIHTGLFKQNPKRFAQEYQEAEAYEKDLERALAAKEINTTKIYRSEIERLEKEIEILEEAKTKPGLTVGDVMQIEMNIDNKRRDTRELNEKLTKRIKKGSKLNDEENFEMAVWTAGNNLKDLDDYFEKDKQRIKHEYSHLWTF